MADLLLFGTGWKYWAWLSGYPVTDWTKGFHGTSSLSFLLTNFDVKPMFLYHRILLPVNISETPCNQTSCIEELRTLRNWKAWRAELTIALVAKPHFDSKQKALSLFLVRTALGPLGQRPGPEGKRIYRIKRKFLRLAPLPTLNMDVEVVAYTSSPLHSTPSNWATEGQTVGDGGQLPKELLNSRCWECWDFDSFWTFV